MMSAKAAAAVIRDSSWRFFLSSFFQIVQAIEHLPKVVLMLGVRWVWKL